MPSVNGILASGRFLAGDPNAAAGSRVSVPGQIGRWAGMADAFLLERAKPRD